MHIYTTLILSLIGYDLNAYLQVGSVSAVDKDGSEFNELIYSFQSGEKTTKLFAIDETSGLLTTLEPLDREGKDTHTLSVRAHDKKMTSLSSYVSVTVQVL